MKASFRSALVFLIGLCVCSTAGNVFNSKFLDPLVTITHLGQVRGSRMSSFNQREFIAFRGIPYAQPPVGELRFKVRFTTFTFSILVN